MFKGNKHFVRLRNQTGSSVWPNTVAGQRTQSLNFNIPFNFLF